MNRDNYDVVIPVLKVDALIGEELRIVYGLEMGIGCIIVSFHTL
jgi:hypothetical protein